MRLLVNTERGLNDTRFLCRCDKKQRRERVKAQRPGNRQAAPLSVTASPEGRPALSLLTVREKARGVEGELRGGGCNFFPYIHLNFHSYKCFIPVSSVMHSVQLGCSRKLGFFVEVCWHWHTQPRLTLCGFAVCTSWRTPDK